MKHTCTRCGNEDEINPASILASKPRKRSPESAEQSRQAGKKGGWPKGKPRKTPVSIVKEQFNDPTSETITSEKLEQWIINDALKS